MDLHFPGKDLLGALWPEVKRLVDPACLEVIGDARAEADEKGLMAPTALEAIRASGYLAAPVPEDMGGGGASLLECCALQRGIAEVDPSFAVALNMHLFSVGMVVEHWRAHNDHAWLLLEAISQQRRVIASAFAEPGLGGSILRSTCTAVPTSGGYAVSGTKRPCSLATTCDLVCVQFVAPTGDGGHELCVGLIPSDAPGIRASRSWDALGMRGSASDTLVLDDVEVPVQLVFHRSPVGQDSDPVFVAGLTWFCLTTAATYLGVTERAVEVAAASLRSDRTGASRATRAQSEAVQCVVGRVSGELLTLVTSLVGQCERFEGAAATGPSFMSAIALKAAAVEHASAATSALAGVLGGRSYARGEEFERLWRDAQAGRFHPPVPVVSERLVGAAVLGQEITFDLVTTGSGGG